MTNPTIEQPTQQHDPDSITPEQNSVGILGMLATSAAKPEHRPFLGSAHQCEQKQSLGLVCLIVKGD